MNPRFYECDGQGTRSIIEYHRGDFWTPPDVDVIGEEDCDCDRCEAFQQKTASADEALTA